MRRKNSLVRELAAHGAITTTKSRAKNLQRETDRMMRLAAKGDLAARRRALSILGNDKDTVSKLFGHYRDLTSQRSSGFTRLVVLPQRRGDGAQMARVEFVAGKKNENIPQDKK